MAKNRIHRFSLVDQHGKAISAAGGVVKVTSAGTPDAVALEDADGASVTNPAALTNGQILVYVDDAVESVDMFILSPTGHFLVLQDVVAGDRSAAMLDTSRMDTTYVIPFDQTDSDITAASEYDTGFDLPANHMVMPDGVGIFVETLDATQKLDVGILAAEGGGDANGFMAAMDVAAAGFIAAEVGFDVGSSAVFMDLTGGDAEFTYGELLCGVGTKAAVAEGSDVNTDEGFVLLRPHIGDGTATSISLTTDSGSDTVAGYIQLPVRIGVPT